MAMAMACMWDYAQPQHVRDFSSRNLLRIAVAADNVNPRVTENKNAICTVRAQISLILCRRSG